MLLTIGLIVSMKMLAAKEGFSAPETTPRNGCRVLVMWEDGTIGSTRWIGHWEGAGEMPPTYPKEIVGWYPVEDCQPKTS